MLPKISCCYSRCKVAYAFQNPFLCSRGAARTRQFRLFFCSLPEQNLNSVYTGDTASACLNLFAGNSQTHGDSTQMTREFSQSHTP